MEAGLYSIQEGAVSQYKMVRETLENLKKFFERVDFREEQDNQNNVYISIPLPKEIRRKEYSTITEFVIGNGCLKSVYLDLRAELSSDIQDNLIDLITPMVGLRNKSTHAIYELCLADVPSIQKAIDLSSQDSSQNNCFVIKDNIIRPRDEDMTVNEIVERVDFNRRVISLLKELKQTQAKIIVATDRDDTLPPEIYQAILENRTTRINVY